MFRNIRGMAVQPYANPARRKTYRPPNDTAITASQIKMTRPRTCASSDGLLLDRFTIAARITATTRVTAKKPKKNHAEGLAGAKRFHMARSSPNPALAGNGNRAPAQSKDSIRIASLGSARFWENYRRYCVGPRRPTVEIRTDSCA